MEGGKKKVDRGISQLMLFLEERALNALADSGEIYTNSSSDHLALLCRQQFEHQLQQNHVRNEKGHLR